MNFDKKNSPWVLGATLLMLLPFLYLVFFTHPIADDLAFGYKSKTNDLFNLVSQTYLTWNGRYSGNFFIHLFNISTHNLVVYRTILLAHFILFVFSFYAFMKSILHQANNITVWSLSLLGVLTYLSITASLAEGFYWYTSVVYYQLSLSFLLLWLALVLKLLRQHYFINKAVHLASLVLLEFIAIGMNETIALTFSFLCFSFLIGVYILKKKELTVFISLFIVAIIGLSIVVFSPGNENRLASYSDNQDLLKSFLMSFMQTLRFAASFIFSITGLLYFLTIACFYSLGDEILQKIKFRFLLVGFFIVLFLSVFPSYYATGILGQHRTLNIPALIFILLITLFALKVGKGLKERLPRTPEKMVVYFFIFFFVFGNGQKVFVDLYSGDAQQYSEDLYKRYQILEEQKSTNNLYKLTKKPESIFIIDISGDSTNWIDQSYLLEYK